MNSYNWTLEEIRSKIREFHLKKGHLEGDDIEKEIKSFKELLILAISGPDVIKQHVFKGFKYSDLSENEWDKLGRELKSDFDVSWDAGHISQGEEQQDRDTTWWTDRVKGQSENYYWDRYKKYTLKGLNKSIVDGFEEYMGVVSSPTAALRFVQAASKNIFIIGLIDAAQEGILSNPIIFAPRLR